MKPGLVGRDLMGLKDINGVMIFVEFLKIGKSNSEEGGVSYMWPKPGKKASYIYRVKGQKVSFGAGIYE